MRTITMLTLELLQMTDELGGEACECKAEKPGVEAEKAGARAERPGARVERPGASGETPGARAEGWRRGLRSTMTARLRSRVQG